MKTLFHGSGKRFNTFEINENHVTRDVANLAEGLGIYMTENRKMAESYGNFIYMIEVNENEVTDFTEEKNIMDIIKKIRQDVNIPIEEGINIPLFVSGVLSGQISTTTLYKEINNHLENDSSFYERYNELFTYEEDCITEKIKNSFLRNVKDIIKYFDRSFNENVYICFKNEEKLKIKNVEENL